MNTCFIIGKGINLPLLLASIKMQLYVPVKQNDSDYPHLSFHQHRKRLPRTYNADYIFWSFGIIGLILSQFEKRVPLKPVLGGVGSVASLHYCS